jgi:hypothetical protein
MISARACWATGAATPSTRRSGRSTSIRPQWWSAWSASLRWTALSRRAAGCALHFPANAKRGPVVLHWFDGPQDWTKVGPHRPVRRGARRQPGPRLLDGRHQGDARLRHPCGRSDILPDEVRTELEAKPPPELVPARRGRPVPRVDQRHQAGRAGAGLELRVRGPLDRDHPARGAGAALSTRASNGMPRRVASPTTRSSTPSSRSRSARAGPTARPYVQPLRIKPSRLPARPVGWRRRLLTSRGVRSRAARPGRAGTGGRRGSPGAPSACRWRCRSGTCRPACRRQAMP